MSIRNIGQILYWGILALLVTVAVLAAMSALGIPKQIRLLVVQSGSMEPAIGTGSLVLVRSQDNYVKEDIITFFKTSDNFSEQAITHRLVGTEDRDGQKMLITKGDANNAPDSWRVAKGDVLGKVSFHVPFLGYLVGFAKTQRGFVLLIVIPATVIVYSEAMNIYKEVKLKVKKKRASNKKSEEDNLTKESSV
jgi:signal peptidase I